VIMVVNVGVVMTYGVPLADSVAKGLESNARILDKVWHNVFAQPSTIRVLQHQRRVPVIQSDRRLDTILNTSVNQIVVVVNGLLIDWTATKRQDARPRE